MTYIKDVCAYEGESREYRGSDGWPFGVIVPRIGATDLAGNNYIHTGQGISVSTDDDGGDVVRFRYDMAAARKIVDKIRYAGSIDLTHWTLVPAMSPEDRDQDNLEFEQEQRELYGT